MPQSSYWIFGGNMEIIADESETATKYDLIKGSFTPGTEVPIHRHTKYSESIFVLTGELTVYTTGQTAVLQAGEHIFIPIGAPHAIVASGSGMTQALTVAAPSGFAKLIRTTGISDKGDGKAPEEMNDMALFMKVSAEIGDELLGPPGARP